VADVALSTSDALQSTSCVGYTTAEDEHDTTQAACVADEESPTVAVSPRSADELAGALAESLRAAENTAPAPS
jgi:hypothetical protein